jgi:hypothetical protein
MMRARRSRSDGQCLRQWFTRSSFSMPSASMMILAARPQSSQLIACTRRLVVLRLTGYRSRYKGLGV